MCKTIWLIHRRYTKQRLEKRNILNICLILSEMLKVCTGNKFKIELKVYLVENCFYSVKGYLEDKSFKKVWLLAVIVLDLIYAKLTYPTSCQTYISRNKSNLLINFKSFSVVQKKSRGCKNFNNFSANSKLIRSNSVKFE